MKKFSAIFLILSIMLALSSCISDMPNTDESEPDSVLETNSETEAETKTDAETETDKETDTEKKEDEEVEENFEEVTYKLNEHTDALKLYGRMSATDTALTCDFAASGIEFNVTAVGAVKIKIKYVQQTVESGKNDDVYLAVIVDGMTDLKQYKVPKGQTVELTVAKFSTLGEHNIKILRKTEIKNGLLDLESVTFAGKFETAPENKELYVEFLGDSITSGYGNLTTNGTSSPQDSDYKDALQAYAYLTAQALGADHSLVSNSGIGLTKGYRVMTMPAFYEAESYYRSTTKAYTPARVPDIVVINLGTNDQSKSADTTAFKNDVKALIENIRALYGKDCPIVWAYGMMKDGYISYVKEATAGMDKVYTVELPKNTQGGNGHPNLAGHKTASEQLTAFIKENVLTVN